MSLSRAFILLVCLGPCVKSALADDGGWDMNVSSYMWLPETQTSVETLQGTVDSTLGAREALEALDVGAMLGVTAQRGAWSFLGDFFYLDLSLHERTPFGRLFSSVDTRTKLAS